MGGESQNFKKELSEKYGLSVGYTGEQRAANLKTIFGKVLTETIRRRRMGGNGDIPERKNGEFQ
jgi:hypothetical protein